MSRLRLASCGFWVAASAFIALSAQAQQFDIRREVAVGMRARILQTFRAPTVDGCRNTRAPETPVVSHSRISARPAG